MHQTCNWDSPTADCSETAATKSDIFRELVNFLSKVYRLIYVAMIVYALGAFVAVGIGFATLLLALYRCPDGRSAILPDSSNDTT